MARLVLPMLRRLLLLALCLDAAALALAQDPSTPDFAAVFRILDERCIECHTQEENEGGLDLETHADLMKGGETGVAIEPGKSAESLLIKYLRGEVEKDGKRRFMPPGKREKLTPEEILLIARWIDAGAKPPRPGAMIARELKVPKIAPKVTPRDAIHAVAATASGELIAAGRFRIVELISGSTREVVRRFEGHAGNVNALAFSADGTQLFTASGENALFGEVRQWHAADGTLIRSIRGHRDALYALALSPDGQTLATGSYDQQIKLWNTATGAEVRTLRGHNGAVYALAFRPDGKLLASVSADRTLKLWDVATGQRRDTLSQSQKELHTVAWSPDGKQVAAAGVDNRIRVWDVSPDAKETTNPLRIARFAHESAILKIAWSGDGATLASAAQDRTVKLWQTAEWKERAALSGQSDWVGALTFADAGRTLIAGRQDGTLEIYDSERAEPMPLAVVDHPAAIAVANNSRVPEPKAAPAKPAAKPMFAGFEPRAIQRGHPATVKLLGKDLAGVTAIKALDARVQAGLAAPAIGAEAFVTVTAPADLPAGSYELAAMDAEGRELGRIPLRVEDLPVLSIPALEVRTVLSTLPVSAWGTLATAGETDHFEFGAKAGQTLVFDLAAKAVGSKADATLALADASGRVLASNNNFDATGDPFIAHSFAAAGRYTIKISDLQMAGSADHFYRLTAGELPFVTAAFPISVPANAETFVELIGPNLPADPTARRVKVQAAAAGEIALPIDGQRFRSRAGFKLLVSDLPAQLENEPNDQPAQATPVQVPASVGGRIHGRTAPEAQHASITPGVPLPIAAAREDQRRVPQVPVTSPLAPAVPTTRGGFIGGDADLFRFESKAGAVWSVETQAAQRGSPIDTKIEVLHPDGRPVERLRLQAVRDSAITFRPIDSASGDVRVENWREMELNELMYLGGEVTKIFRMPEGPDSGFQFYLTGGKRRAYFDTTPTAHALDEPCYIVEPHPPGTKLVANGLPVFPLTFTNDDDGDRELGTDSRVLFTAPADGSYLVRVTDSRGLGGDRFAYQLVIRNAQPDFRVKIDNTNLTLNAGSGQAFTVSVDRKDGFDGDIRVEITGVPEGYGVTTPLVIEAGHNAARGTLNALPGAAMRTDAEWAAVKACATATVAGQTLTREVNPFGKVALGKEPQIFLSLEPAPVVQTVAVAEGPLEITIAPGEIISAWIKVRRNGANGDLRFDVENLPHGVIVDNLGLNGITLLAGQHEGEIALKAAAWVPETDRLCFAVTREAGKQTSPPVLLRVRKKPGVQSLSVK
jgi:hypothetical protein